MEKGPFSHSETSETLLALIISTISSWYSTQCHLLLPDKGGSSDSTQSHLFLIHFFIFSSSRSLPPLCMPTLGPHYIISSGSCPLCHPSLLHTVCPAVTRPPDLCTFGEIKAGNLWMWIFRTIFSIVIEKGEGKLPYLRNTNNSEK